MNGVLLMAYGSPDTLADVEAYYMDILRGRKPSPENLHELEERYRAIGGGSPLLKITSQKADFLQQKLGEDFKVYLGMRHWHPYINQAVKQMKNDGISYAVGIVMAPHYSKMSIGKYIEAVENANSEIPGNLLSFSYIESWHNEPLYINALVEKITNILPKFSDKEKENLHVIFTAHSLPEKILEWNDPYPAQLMETSELVANKLNIDSWSFAFQSAGRTQEKWLGPDLLEVLNQYAAEGGKSVLVCSVGFISDHLEVLYDIDIEAKKHVSALGIHLERAESLNVNQNLIELFADLVKRKFNG